LHALVAEGIMRLDFNPRRRPVAKKKTKSKGKGC
jgi:hypothetical protein